MTSSDAVPHQLSRIIDASLNRTGGGLRLLENITRPMLDNAGLTQRLKTMLHSLLVGNPNLQQQLLEVCNAAGDTDAQCLRPRRGRTQHYSEIRGDWW